MCNDSTANGLHSFRGRRDAAKAAAQRSSKRGSRSKSSSKAKAAAKQKQQQSKSSSKGKAAAKQQQSSSKAKAKQQQQTAAAAKQQSSSRSSSKAAAESTGGDHPQNSMGQLARLLGRKKCFSGRENEWHDWSLKFGATAATEHASTWVGQALTTDVEITLVQPNQGTARMVA